MNDCLKRACSIKMIHMTFIILMVFVSTVVDTHAYADTQDDIDDLQQRFNQINEEDNADNKTQRQLLTKIIGSLKSQNQLKNQIESLRKEIDGQPAQIKREQAQLEKRVQSPSLKSEESISDEQLNKNMVLVDTRILEIERDMALLQQERSQAEIRQQTLREELTGLRLAQEVVDSQRPTTFVELRQQLSSAEFKERQLRLQAMELELLALPSRADIAHLLWQQLDKEREQQVLLREKLNTLKQSRQKNELEKTLRDASDGLTEGNVPVVLLNAYKENQQLSNELRFLLADIEKAEKNRNQLQQRLLKVGSTFKSLTQQLELGVGRISPDQRRFIFDNREPLDTGKTTDSINLLRLEASLIEQKKNDVTTQKNILLSANDLELSVSQAEIYQEMLDDRLRLIEQLETAYDQQITALNQVLSIEKQINQQISTNSDFVVKQLLWTPASEPIDLEWLSEIVTGVQQLHESWSNKSTTKLIKPADMSAFYIIILVFTIIIILWLQHYHKTHRQIWCDQVGNVVHDRFRHSMQEMFLAIVTALPIPLVIWVIQHSLINTDYNSATTLSNILSMIAVITWIFLSIRNFFKLPNGLFSGHFGVHDDLLNIATHHLNMLYIIGLPLIISYMYLWDINSDQIRSGLVRLVMLALSVCGFLFLARLWKIKDTLNQLSEVSHIWLKSQIWIAFMTLFNAVMFVLIVAGYTFTVTSVVYAMLQIILVLLAAMILYKQGMRLVLISERRLEFDRAKARRAEILAAREKQEDEPPLETNYINMQTVSDHSRTLLKTATLVTLLVFLWGMIGELLPFWGALDSVQMWTTLSEDGEVVQQITLKSVFLGITMLVLSWLAAYNLPGLLELLILRNMDLTPGTGYAISTLSKYLLLLIGVLGAFSHFGLEWGKLQWLVAALSVGLGFGLQEIVANFVSGLIILFEKPVRIGDTVTIDNLTGIVTKIQIRATTIVDWDRKEVIIPNKTFITQQLINWSLTDSVTRIVIPVGVAYGSDTELARQILVDAALEESRILKDPKPEAYFTTFADSTLNIELRIYVNAMSDRLEMTHVVNTKIAQKFKEAGIEIAFPQLDVHITKND